MSKGSQPVGQATSQVVNPTAAAQLPYLQDLWGTAKNLYNANPPNPYLQQGFQDIYGTGQSVDAGLRPYANQPFYNAAVGNFGAQNSPAYGGYQQYAGGTAAPQQTFQGIANAAMAAAPQAAQAIAAYAPQLAQFANQATGPNAGLNALMSQAGGGGAGLQQLQRAAGGQYLNSNPYIDQMYRAAADPVARTYQTSTAPTTDAAFSNSGRYGSGAAAGARSSNEQNLGRALGDLSSNLYGNQYARERQLQDAAAQQYGSLVNQAGSQYGSLVNQGYDSAIRGLTAAGGLQTAATAQDTANRQQALQAAQQQMAGQQYGLTGLSGGYNAGNEAALRAMAAYPQLAEAQFIGPKSTVEAGKGLTTSPWLALDKFQTAIGAGLPGSENSSRPYFQNQLSDTLAGITGGLGVANQLGGKGGLLGGLGGLGGAAEGSAFTAPVGSLISDFGAGGVGAAFPGTLATEALGTTAMTAGGSALAEAAPLVAASGGWIVCTELVRQGKMPRKHWAAGLRVFDGYPEFARRGYYVWAIPSVRHLRRHPNSRYSRLLGTVFRWRAEDIAARRGVKGARRLWRGRAVTAALALPCALLGMFAPAQDWQSVYREEVKA